MIETLILIKGNSLKRETLLTSLMNAKQIVIGSAPGFGMILHVAANSPVDLGNALLAFSQVPGVAEVSTLALRTPQ